jgi:conjugal transfer pilus assembly protein TraL
MISTLKSGKSDGFIFHFAYWYGIPGFDLPLGPDGTVRELIE